MSKRSKINKIQLPKPQAESIKQKRQTLPFNGNALTDKSLSFSFACFDRTHKLFNLADISEAWFLDLLDCLKNVCNKTIPELQTSIYDLHRVNWNNANASLPNNSEGLEYWQFRLNKTRGRVIGFIIDNVFYIVWLDAHHNLTDSEGYEPARKRRAPKSEYEQLTEKMENLELRLKEYETDI